MARIVWSEAALMDLQAITVFIARDSVNYARRFGERLRAAPKALKQFPRLGAMVPEFERESLREIIVSVYDSRR